MDAAEWVEHKGSQERPLIHFLRANLQLTSHFSGSPVFQYAAKEGWFRVGCGAMLQGWRRVNPDQIGNFNRLGRYGEDGLEWANTEE